MSGGLVLAAPSSGSGKTTLALALLRRLRGLGVRAAAAKVGPDYIDTSFLEAAVGGLAINLDTWAMRPALVERLVRRLESAGEIVLCEGAMGLFDGAGKDERGSTADLAARLGWPVVLIVDTRHQGASVAALVEGFMRHRRDIEIAGVIFNRVGSARHAGILEAATERAAPELPRLGSVPRDPALTIPERHLGLVQAGEHERLDAFLDRAAEIVGSAVDVGHLAKLARPARRSASAGDVAAPLPPLGQRIAVARDTAFAFAYETVLEGWREAGAELSFFSPLADEAPARDADAVYLPGGYPELHAAQLATGPHFLAGLRRAAAQGSVVYGECGGFMVLGRSLVDAQGRMHAMAGLLPVTTSFAQPKLHLGYREMRLALATPLGRAGRSFRGHEFHYANLIECSAPPLFEVGDSEGTLLGSSGAVAGQTMGSFLHLIDRANYPQGSDSGAEAEALSLTP